MNFILFALSWIFGVIFALGAIIELLTGSFITSMGAFLLAAALIPPIRNYITGKIDANHPALIGWGLALIGIVLFGKGMPVQERKVTDTSMPVVQREVTDEIKEVEEPKTETHAKIIATVTEVIDGDTVNVLIDNEIERIRLIGVDAPEHQDCYYRESLQYAKSLLDDQQVQIEKDESQGEYDKYDRLLAYLILPDGSNFSQIQLEEGAVKEYTYDAPYKYQKEFQDAESRARSNKIGIWNPESCKKSNELDSKKKTQPPTEELPAPLPITTSSMGISEDPSNSQPAPTSIPVNNNDGYVPPNQSCVIKGNINSKKKKLYHLPGCPSYNQTKINKTGERWFCTEEEAKAAGWTKAGNC